MIGTTIRRHPARIAAVALATLSISAAHADPPSRATLRVQLTRLRSDAGWVGCTLYADARGFPEDADAALQQRWCSITDGTATCRFDPVTPGVHAVACFHDEDGDGELDTNLLGIPREGTVVSRHARGRLGPPSFDEASFELPAGGSRITLRMSY